jgi:FecR protein
LGIEQYDDVRTKNGRLELTFLDDSKVKMTENSKLVIDEFVYDGNPKTSKIAMKFAEGTARFITGQTGKIDKQNINLRTPSATIAVRGTDFTTTVDETGKSLVLLLPEADGSVGEITVTNAAGTVTLNQAFQATVVVSYERNPTAPKVIEGIDINMIDNSFIISPPKDVAKVENQQSQSQSSSDPLSKNFLDTDAINQDDLKNNTIDDNLIDQNFFIDFFSLGNFILGTEKKGNIILKGTKLGIDKTTGIDTSVTSSSVNMVRQTETQFFQFNSPINTTDTININQNNKNFNVVINNGAGGTVINVNQSN